MSDKIKQSHSLTYKVITCGDGGVGKTTLLHRFVSNEFLIDTKMTIGVGFFLKHVGINENKTALQIWDFGGEDHFRPFLDSYAQGANGAILAFDLTRMKTLHNLQQWVNIIKKEDPDIPILFIGAKMDLKEQISVDDDYALEFKEQFGFYDYLKVSSKTGENVQLAFESLTKKMLERMQF